MNCIFYFGTAVVVVVAVVGQGSVDSDAGDDAPLVEDIPQGICKSGSVELDNCAGNESSADVVFCYVEGRTHGVEAFVVGGEVVDVVCFLSLFFVFWLVSAIVTM